MLREREHGMHEHVKGQQIELDWAGTYHKHPNSGGETADE